MNGSKQDIEIDEKLSYSLASQCFNKPLRITNHSDHFYVFKIKTNQKTVISMQLTHDFISPHSQRQISIKLADKPHETTPLKLELNYAIPSDEDFNSKDSKMTSYPKQAIFKRIITIKRDDSAVEVKSKEVKQQKKQSPKKDYLGESMNASGSFSRQEHSPMKYPSILELGSKTEQLPISFIKVVSEEFKVPDEYKQEPIRFEVLDKVQVIKQKESNVNEQINAPVIPVIRMVQQVQQEGSQNKLSPSERIFISAISESMQVCEFQVYKQQSNKSTNKDAEKIVAELNQKINNEKQQIMQLRSLEQPTVLRSIRSFPSITLLAILAFILGSFSNWICF